MRRQSFFYMGFITATVVSVYGLRNSYNKLIGESPNQDMCERAGVEYVEAKLY